MFVNLFTGPATGLEAEDGTVTIAWSVREGVEVLDAQVIEGTMLVLRARVTEQAVADGTIPPQG